MGCCVQRAKFNEYDEGDISILKYDKPYSITNLQCVPTFEVLTGLTEAMNMPSPGITTEVVETKCQMVAMIINLMRVKPMLFCNQIRGMNQASMLAPKLDIEGCISYLKMCEPSHPMEVCKDLGQGIMAVR